jgi:hypothetical protein
MIEERPFFDFLAKRLPGLLSEWHARRNHPSKGG